MKIRGKPNVDDFLHGGNSENMESNKLDSDVSSLTVSRANKLVSLPRNLLLDLKRRSINDSERIGRRVTETEIIESALEKYLYSK